MLTQMQQAFCEYYIANHNATQAAIQAGYSKKTAYSQGQRLLKNVEIKKYLEEAENKASMGRIASAKDILEFWTTVMQDAEKPLKDRISASKMLAEFRGLFDGRGDENKTNSAGGVVIVDDVPQEGEEYVNQESDIEETT